MNASPSPVSGGGCYYLIRAITRNLINLSLSPPLSSTYLSSQPVCLCTVKFSMAGRSRVEMSGVRLQAGAGSPAPCSLWLSEKPEICLFQAGLTLSAQLPSPEEDMENGRRGGYAETRRSASAHAHVPLVTDAAATMSLTLLSELSRSNISSAVAAVQLEMRLPGSQPLRGRRTA